MPPLQCGRSRGQLRLGVGSVALFKNGDRDVRCYALLGLILLLTCPVAAYHSGVMYDPMNGCPSRAR
jgi:hypothetical protein